MGKMKPGYARKRDKNEPGIIAALELAGATVVILDKPLDLLVGFEGDTDLLEVKNGNQPPSWQRITPDQSDFFRTWKGKRATVVTTMAQALSALNIPSDEIETVVNILSSKFDLAGEPRE